MASTTAFYTGLSGLSVHARKLDVIGNNIANVNTTAYKSTRLELQNNFPRTINPGTPPQQFIGGTNPYQVGLGVGIAGTTQNFSVGSITPTGDPRDLALEGDGFFIVQRGDETFYTRNGAFRQDANDDLVTINGEKVLGYGVDEDYNVIDGALTEINIPVGRLQIAEPTTLVNFAGNLNAGGDVAGAGSLTNLLAPGRRRSGRRTARSRRRRPRSRCSPTRRPAAHCSARARRSGSTARRAAGPGCRRRISRSVRGRRSATCSAS